MVWQYTMGGNALKKVKNRRLERKLYQEVERHVVETIAKLADKVGVPRYFDSKTSFGDLDIVYSIKQQSSMNPDKLIKEVMTSFGSKERVKNGHVTSIDYQFDADSEAFQIDLIYVPYDHFEVNMFYLSYGDMGAIFGMIFKTYGFGYGGEPGLFHQVCVDWDPCKNIGRINLTWDPVQICQVLQISDLPAKDCYATMHHIDLPNVFGGREGLFGEYDDVFDYVTSSPLFRPTFWTARSLHWNNDERTRVKVRPMYRHFIEEYIPRKFDFHPDVTFSPNLGKMTPLTTEERDIFVEDILDRFGVLEKRNLMIHQFEQKQKAKLHFNGQLITELLKDPLLIGRSLGIFIGKLVSKYPKLRDPEYLLQHDQETINKLITEFHKEYKTS